MHAEASKSIYFLLPVLKVHLHCASTVLKQTNSLPHASPSINYILDQKNGIVFCFLIYLVCSGLLSWGLKGLQYCKWLEYYSLFKRPIYSSHTRTSDVYIYISLFICATNVIYIMEGKTLAFFLHYFIFSSYWKPDFSKCLATSLQKSQPPTAWNLPPHLDSAPPNLSVWSHS